MFRGTNDLPRDIQPVSSGRRLLRVRLFTTSGLVQSIGILAVQQVASVIVDPSKGVGTGVGVAMETGGSEGAPCIGAAVAHAVKENAMPTSSARRRLRLGNELPTLRRRSGRDHSMRRPRVKTRFVTSQPYRRLQQSFGWHG